MNRLADRMTPNITTMIRMDHSHVLALFRRFKPETAAGKKHALVTNACLALEVHAQLEEEIFYPAVREVMPGDPVLEKSQPEHDEMRRLIARLRELTGDGQDIVPEGTALDDTFMDLMRVVLHHVADEETRLLPAAERLLTDRLGELGAQMLRRRGQLIKPHVGEIAASSARSFPSATAVGVLLTAGAVAAGVLLARRADGRGTRMRSER